MSPELLHSRVFFIFHLFPIARSLNINNISVPDRLKYRELRGFPSPWWHGFGFLEKTEKTVTTPLPWGYQFCTLEKDHSSHWIFLSHKMRMLLVSGLIETRQCRSRWLLQRFQFHLNLLNHISLNSTSLNPTSTIPISLKSYWILLLYWIILHWTLLHWILLQWLWPG